MQDTEKLLAETATATRLITPVVLTCNEEDNLDRTLGALQWASEVVIVDSGSTDRSQFIASKYPNTVWYTRHFDTHAVQWRYAIRDCDVKTEYVLALDADMVTPPEFVREAGRVISQGRYSGAMVSFDYFVEGCALLGSIYPPQMRVFRPGEVRISDVGHSQKFDVSGPLYHFQTRVIHDDRKPMERWVDAQVRYSLLEYEHLRQSGTFGLKDGLRLAGLMPFVAAILGYMRAGGPLGGKPAVRYAFERLTFESLLMIRLLSGLRRHECQAGSMRAPKENV